MVEGQGCRRRARNRGVGVVNCVHCGRTIMSDTAITVIVRMIVDGAASDVSSEPTEKLCLECGLSAAGGDAFDAARKAAWKVNAKVTR